MANPTINQRIDFDASLNLDAESQRRFERQLGGGFFKKLEQASKKAGSLLAKPIQAASRAASRMPQVRIKTGVGDAAKRAAEALGITIKKVAPPARRVTTTTGGVAGKDGGGTPNQAVVNAMKVFRTSVQQITKLVNTAIRATMQQVQKITQAVTRMISLKGGGARDPNDPAVKEENKAQAEAARDPIGGSGKPVHVIVDSGQIKVTNKDAAPPKDDGSPTPPPQTPPPGEKLQLSFDPTSILKILMQAFDRIYNISKIITAGAVKYTQGRGGKAGFEAAVGLAEELGITTDEAAAKMNEALNAGVEATTNIYGSINSVAQVSEYLGISISELVAGSRKMFRNFQGSFDLAAAASGLANTQLFSVQEAYAVVSAAASAMGKSGYSADAMVGRTVAMIKAFGDEIGPAMAQMQEVFRGQTLGDTIKEIMLMGPSAARQVLAKAQAGLGSDQFGRDTSAMISKALASGDIIAMAEALQLVGPAAEDLAQTFRGKQLGVGYQSRGLAQVAYRQVTGMGAQGVQDIRVKRAAGVLGAVGGAPSGGTTGAVAATREMGLSVTDALQRTIDDMLIGPLGGVAEVVKQIFLNPTSAFQELGNVINAMVAYVKTMMTPLTRKDPLEEAKKAGKDSPIVNKMIEFFGGAPANDFIYQDAKGGMGAKITPINPRDQFFGAKPGGAIDRAIASTASGMSRTMTTAGDRTSSGVTNVTVNVNGGDLGKVYEVVRNVLQQSGVRPPAGAYAT